MPTSRTRPTRLASLLLLLLPLAALAAPERPRRRAPQRPATPPGPAVPGRLPGFGKWRFSGGPGRGHLAASDGGVGHIVISARELAQLLDGSPFDGRAFFDTVDYSELRDDCGPRLRTDPRDVDPEMTPGERAEKVPTRSTGRVAPLFGGYVVERFGRDLNGTWQRYRVFIAPRTYLVEPWNKP